jgi:hypothetical protein
VSTSDSSDGRWAKPVDRLHVQDLPTEAVNLNVEGRRLAGALQGFGPLWQKTYWARLSGASASAADVVAEWKRDYPAFWPSNNHLYRALARLEPGDVAVINASQRGIRLSTGVMVMYADDESFAFALPQGHILAGWITFSARDDAGTTVAQVQAFFRTSDPLYDAIFRVYFNRKEDQIWHHTLRELAARFEVDAIVQQSATCIDPKLLWRNAGNIRYNAGVRTALHQMMSPVRRLVGPRSPAKASHPRSDQRQ